jgi:CRISPR-associated endoribonuclease Cas6
MYFVAMLMTLRPEHQASPLTVADGVFAHAALFHALSGVDSEAGRALHEMRRHKHLTVAVVESKPQHSTLRLTFMGEEGVTYANLLLTALERCSLLRFGSASWRIASVDLSPTVWSGVQTWADFSASPASPYLQVTFVTPTAIMKLDGDRQRFTALYPEPLAFFSGLLRRWQALEGPSLPEGLLPFLQAGKCLISGYELRTEKFQTPERTQLGFRGWVTYESAPHAEAYVVALHALARLAPFTGVGYQTARGMGAVRVSIPS